MACRISSSIETGLCNTSGIASMTPPPGVLLAVDSTWVTYNRYRVNATTMGRVDVLAYKV